MVDLLYHLISLFFLYSFIILLQYYINSRSLIICCLFSGDIYLSVSISCSLVCELFCGEVFENFVILPAILFPIKSPVPSAVFWTTLFEAVLSASVADCLGWSRNFWLYLQFKFLLIILPILFFSYFWQNTKIHNPLKIFDPLVELNIVSFFICYTLIKN